MSSLEKVMTPGISRRQLLKTVGERLRRLFRTLAPFVVIILAAWVAVTAIQLLRVVTLEGWELIGCFLLAALLLTVIRWGAVRVYSGLPIHGRALCDAAGEASCSLFLLVAGAFVWRQFRTGEEASGVVISLALLIVIARRARKAYDQTVGEPRSPGDG
jgi:hypothetical protein